ncbi:MFS transporter [Streptomyces sp. LHD-70]|uniref:MFS transporter n=1 Tax=Streptomyces sp. LHD-70 TaxID=3072140 RepID=UPI00280CDD27|nr:MFS transporter [Streptomyces sp. LHD-70]MDQ8703882.1 MFS transporter [Streptomyces sp. LHD-70]
MTTSPAHGKTTPGPARPGSAGSAPPGASRVRWMIVWLAFGGLTINYLDRANLGVALPFIGEEITLTKFQQGMILAAFFWSYDFCQLIAGWYVDKVGPRRTFTGAAIWWSLFTMVTAAAQNFASLFGARLALGVGESPAPSTSAKVVSRWFPRQERAFATAIWDSGSRVGGVLALPVVTALVALAGWRAAFIVTGLVGFVWAAAWWRLYRDPEEHPKVNAAELAHIRDGGARSADADSEAARKLRWRDLFGYRTVRGMMLGFFCLNMCIYFFITFFPTYLVEERGFTLLKLGLFGALPGICAVFAAYAGGWFADRAIKRGADVTKVRKTVIISGMLGGSVIGLAVLVPAAWMALALLSVAYSSLAFAASGIWSLPADVAPSDRHVASVGGIQNFASNLAGIGSPLLVGYLVDSTGSFVVPLLVVACFAVVGALSYAFIVQRAEPLPVRSS